MPTSAALAARSWSAGSFLGVKVKSEADRLALEVQVVERDALGGRRDLLQAKTPSAPNASNCGRQ